MVGPRESYKLPGSSYIYEPEKVGFCSKKFPSLVFYKKIVSVVVWSSRKAKRGLYGYPEWIHASQGILRAAEHVGTRINIEGLDNIRGLDRPCVFIGNHMSTLETFLLPMLIGAHMDVTFIVKQSLITFPVFKHVMISRNPIVVGRANPREDLAIVMNEGTQKLQDGTSIIVFPQRTRATQFSPEEFNTIGVKLAKKAGVPVVPIALKTNAWGTGKGSLLRDFGPFDPTQEVHIAFDKMIEIKNKGQEEHQHIIQFITEKLDSWK